MGAEVAAGHEGNSPGTSLSSAERIAASRAKANIRSDRSTALGTNPLGLDINNGRGWERRFVCDAQSTTYDSENEPDNQSTQADKARNGEHEDEDPKGDVTLGHHVEQNPENEDEDPEERLDRSDRDRISTHYAERFVFGLNSCSYDHQSPEEDEYSPDEGQNERRCRLADFLWWTDWHRTAVWQGNGRGGHQDTNAVRL